MRVHRSILCSLVLAAAPVLARAQALSSQLVEQINTSTRARVRLVTGSRGTLYAPRADSTSLAYDRSEFLNRGGSVVALSAPLPIGQIAEIQVSNGSHADNGAKIGGGVGAGLALLAVAACSGSICQPSTGQAVGAVVVWTFIGAGVGALIGSLSPRWKTIYAVR
jgi:hypothetical protein